MKINPISINTIKTYPYGKHQNKHDFSYKNNSFEFPKYNEISFAGYFDLSKNISKKRKRQLRHLGLNNEYIEQIAEYDSEKYKRTLNLLKKGCLEECACELSNLPEEQYKRAEELIAHNVIDETIYPLTALDDVGYHRILDLKDKGVDSEFLEIFGILNEQQFEDAKKLMLQGHTPKEAGYLGRLNEDGRRSTKSLMDLDVPITIASDIAGASMHAMIRFLDLIQSGVDPNTAEEMLSLNPEQIGAAKLLLSMNLDDNSANQLARLNPKEREKALNMYYKSVAPEYITSILDIEEGRKKNGKYKEYRERGYSKTSSYALSLLEENQKESLMKLINIHPEIYGLLRDEYDVQIVTLQDCELSEVILTKEIPLNTGSKIMLVRTFDEAGDKTESRTEEASNQATSSTMSKNNSDVYKLKYDKYGNVREMVQIMQNPETGAVDGVIYSVASKLLPGVFETNLYYIDDFISDCSSDKTDEEIPDSVKNKGVPISTVTKEDDGTIVFKEVFSASDCKSKRKYTEKRDENGNIISSSYYYKIKDKDNNILMNTQRSFVRNSDGNAVNIINGIEYTIKYDDKNKTVKISDGKNEKKLQFNKKLAYYSKDVLWEVIKQLHVDSLLTLDRSIKHWNYCNNKDSIADGYHDTISTGKNMSVIAHEIGHFKDYAGKVSQNKDFVKIYADEMYEFFGHVPFNEMEFISYLSPRADLNESSGIGEFVAESNIVLTTYGTNENELETRTIFLARFFPRSIAKAAELLKITSTKSLLEE